MAIARRSGWLKIVIGLQWVRGTFERMPVKRLTGLVFENNTFRLRGVVLTFAHYFKWRGRLRLKGRRWNDGKPDVFDALCKSKLHFHPYVP